jgi:hypothetical protein
MNGQPKHHSVERGVLRDLEHSKRCIFSITNSSNFGTDIWRQTLAELGAFALLRAATNRGMVGRDVFTSAAYSSQAAA